MDKMEKYILVDLHLFSDYTGTLLESTLRTISLMIDFQQ